jgi:arylsulfatase A
MFTCDNGTGRGITTQTTAGPVKGGKSRPNDAGMHVPLIVSWPGVVPAGSVCTDLVDFTDFLPTILQATATSLPPDLVCDGRSFLPQIRGEAGDPREWIACWYDPRHGQTSQHRTFFVRDKRYKLYHDGRMFDLQTDPAERVALQQPFHGDAASANVRLAAAIGSMPKWKVDAK